MQLLIKQRYRDRRCKIGVTSQITALSAGLNSISYLYMQDDWIYVEMIIAIQQQNVLDFFKSPGDVGVFEVIQNEFSNSSQWWILFY